MDCCKHMLWNPRAMQCMDEIWLKTLSYIAILVKEIYFTITRGVVLKYVTQS